MVMGTRAKAWHSLLSKILSTASDPSGCTSKRLSIFLPRSWIFSGDSSARRRPSKCNSANCSRTVSSIALGRLVSEDDQGHPLKPRDPSHDGVSAGGRFVKSVKH